ncbi:MAG TPA: hypothetical protein VHN59_05190 [Chitinophagaceae bacterium]|nr:hypothetical protein [Chitinophagaceae bacterium]
MMLKNPYASPVARGTLLHIYNDMMRTLFLLFLFGLYHAQPGLAQYSAPWNLGAYSQLHTDIFSFAFNQAALAELKQGGIGAGGERKYLLEELAAYRLVLALPSASGNFGFQGISKGFSNYRDSRFGLAYARQLGKKAAVGLQFNYNTLRIAGYGSAKTLSAEAGLILHLSSRLHTGMHLNNPGGKYSGNKIIKLPSIYTMGWGYDFSAQLFLSGEIVKEENQPTDARISIQYVINPALLIRTMIQTANATAWFGAGLARNRSRLDIYTGYHPQLGPSAGIQLLYEFKKEDK